jgi:hypothetical protein
VLIFERVRNRDVSFAANGLGRDAARHGLGFEECERVEINAKLVVGAIANPGLGVDGARQMIVKVGALGHSLEKLTQFKRILADGFERVRGSLFDARWVSDYPGAIGLSSRRLRKG